MGPGRFKEIVNLAPEFEKLFHGYREREREFLRMRTTKYVEPGKSQLGGLL